LQRPGKPDLIAALLWYSLRAMLDATGKPRGRRRINWINVSTVLSAAILISAEVFGAAFAGGWAFGNLFGLGQYGTYILQVLFFTAGLAIMIAFIRAGMHIEPFTSRE
jgi:hypothetical protein